MDLLRTIPKGESRSFINLARQTPLRHVPRRLRDLRRLVVYHDGRIIIRDIEHIIVYPVPKRIRIGKRLPGVMKARCLVECKKGPRRRR